MNPTSIANLVHRFRASSLTGFTNGASVGSVTFETGGFIFTAAGTAQPTYVTGGLGGLPALRFNGTTNALSYSSGGSSVAQPFTIVAVVNISSATQEQQLFHFGGAEVLMNSAPLMGYQAYMGTTLLAGGFVATGGQTFSVSTPGDNSAQIKNSGNTQANDFSGNGGIVPGTGNRIGSHTAGNRFFAGDVYEILIYSRSLDLSTAAGDRTILGTYVQNTYGVTMADYSLSGAWFRA